MSGEGGNTAELRTATWLWLPERKSSVIRTLPSSVMPSGTRAQPRFLRLSEVLEMTGMGKTFIYARMKEGIFPSRSSWVLARSSGTSRRSSSGWKSRWHPDDPVQSRSQPFVDCRNTVVGYFSTISEKTFVLVR